MADGKRNSETGQGEAVLLLGHDGRALAPTHRVINADLTAGRPLSALRHLLDDLGISAVNIVARGEAAGTALAFAAAYPQNVLRLALIAPHGLTEATILCPVLILGEAETPKSMPRVRVERPGVIDAQLASFISERLSSFDNRELRSAFGSFMTGVTIVTTAGADGRPRGFTANSFTSVSLEPPLLMICIGKHAASMGVFRHARGFAVNVLSEAQKDTSVLFASKRPDKFEATRWRAGPFGNPLIEGSAAWFDCARYQVIDAGDHIILMGHIEAFSYSDANPLGYARGHYITLGLEQAAVNAASSASRTVVGAILENDNRLVLLPDPSRPGGLALPEVGRLGSSGSASQLHELLRREGLDATLGFLFAVFENPGTREQCIYYRGEALLHARGRTVLADFEDIPWDRLPDEATRSMLRRYAAERKIGRFKVYSGDHRQGTVKAVD
ncbi:flavin reductase family protein [Aestuariivirga sp.]|uniref:flavin reductase family protein n=1 Tax=Aestuariivirga sp. TaxID=2650926 RepID=UPI0025BE5254|nr:flavin reductase family protein [Aestuariivirga sp.]